MTGFRGAGEAISEDTATFAALEITEPSDVEQSVQAYATAVQDIGYLGMRLVQRLEPTALHPAIIDRIFVVASGIDAMAGDLTDLERFSLTGRG